MAAPEQVGADGAAEELGLLHDHSHLAAQVGAGVLPDRSAHDLHTALSGVVEAGDEADEAGFAAAGAADDADGLAALGGEIDVGEAGCACALVGQAHMVETDGVAGLFRRNIAGELGRELHAGLGVQNRLHTACTGQSLAHLNDEVGQLDQLDQDLVHVVDQRDDVAGGHAPDVDLDAAYIQQRHDGKVDDNVGQRVHQGGDVAHMELHFGQQLIGVLEAVHLALFLVEGADDAHAGQVFAGEAQNPVQAGLHRLIQRPGDDHDAEDHDAQQRDSHHEDEGGAEVDRKGHDHGAEHHEGAAQEQTEEEVQSALHLIDVAGHPGDEGAGTHGVHLGKAQRLDVLKQRMTQTGGITHGGFGREVLGRQAAHEADDGQKQQDAAPHEDVVEIVGRDTHVDDVGHHKRHEQVKRSFQHLEKRCKHALALVVAEIAKHFVQGSILPFFHTFSRDAPYYNALPTGMLCFCRRKPALDADFGSGD